MSNPSFLPAQRTYECTICGEEVTHHELAKSARREAHERSRSVGSLNPEHIICRECEVSGLGDEGAGLFGGRTSEVWKWNLSGITLDPGEKVFLALNY